MRTTLLLSILVFVCFSSFAQTKFIDDSIKNLLSSDSLIIWEEGRKLTVDDFQGKPVLKSPANAMTSYNILTIYSLDSPFQWRVISYFVKNRSWVKIEQLCSNTIEHEQGHFDIGELYARKLSREIGNIKCIIDSMPWKIYYARKRISKEVEIMQNKYDKETNYSRNIQKQTMWTNKLRDMLNNDGKK